MADREARQFEAWQERFSPGLGGSWPNEHDLLDLVGLASVSGQPRGWLWHCRCGKGGSKPTREAAVAAYDEHTKEEGDEEVPVLPV